MKKRTERRRLCTVVVCTPKRLGTRDDAAYTQPVSLYGPAPDSAPASTGKRKKLDTGAKPVSLAPLAILLALVALILATLQ